MATEQDRSEGRTRSPAHPSINLEGAIERARVLYEHIRRSPAHIDVVLEHWGYDAKSGPGSRVLAALKQFGLLADEGKKENRQARLTRLALDILMPHEAGSDEQREAIKQAALLPKLHDELWQKYEGNLPSDAALRRYLILDKNFNDGAAAPFISNFRATIAYARLADGDTITEDGLEEGEAKKPQKTPEPPPRSWGEQVKSQMVELPITLSSLNVAVLKLPAKMAKQDFDLIKRMLDMWESALVEPAGSVAPAKGADASDPMPRNGSNSA